MIERHHRIVLLLLAAGVAISLASVLFVQRGMIFDDAFISYRYSKNLASGFGLTWNPGEAPVEGYTNFLLVVALAPAIKMGLDPLLVTRIWSVLAALGIAWLLRQMAVRHYGASAEVANMAALAFLPIGNSFLLATVGLETVIYVFFLFWSFSIVARLFDELSVRAALAFGFIQFLAFLLRPEALVLPVLAAGVVLLDWRRHLARLPAVIGALAVSLVAPFLLYLLWKQLHFGTIIPAPFHIKATAAGLFHPRGLDSVMTYLSDHRVLLMLAVGSFLVPGATEPARQRLLAAIYSVFLVLFYLRVDTLMDVYQRFLYPATPFLYFLALPAICLLFERLSNFKASWPTRLVGTVAVIGLVFFQNPAEAARTAVEALRGEDRFDDSEALMKKEHKIGRILSEYEGIEEITIAWGNAGVIPYFSGAKVVDTVGLNDQFIAQNRDLDELVDYFFARRPDLAIVPTTKDLKFYGGHSYLGQHMAEWRTDPRWDNYAYAGTITTSIDKIHHYFVRRDYTDFDRFFSFLRQRVVDVVLDPEPIAMGTHYQETLAAPPSVDRIPAATGAADGAPFIEVP